MGWNNLIVEAATALQGPAEEAAIVYFVHSYYVVPADAG